LDKRRRIWTSWWFRIWSSSCSWWRCSLRRICNLFWWIYNFFCILNNQSCWFVCFVKPGDVCLGFHRSENRFGHACVRLLSRRIIRHWDELSCLGLWNISFYFYYLIFFFFYEELTVFRGGHMRFPTIGTLVSMFTSVAIMALLWTLETDYFPFALILSMSKFWHLKQRTGFGIYGFTLTL
jgi:hypothetical protein